MSAIGGTSADDVWAVGVAIHHCDGKTWSSVPVAGQRGTLSSISVVTKDDIWAAGFYGYVAHFDGKVWTGQRLDVARVSTDPAAVGWFDLLDVVAWPNEVWVAPSRPNYYRFDGARWSAVPGPFNIQSFWGTGPRDVWTPSGSMTTHFDGTQWCARPRLRPRRSAQCTARRRTMSGWSDGTGHTKTTADRFDTSMVEHGLSRSSRRTPLFSGAFTRRLATRPTRSATTAKRSCSTAPPGARHRPARAGY